MKTNGKKEAAVKSAAKKEKEGGVAKIKRTKPFFKKKLIPPPEIIEAEKEEKEEILAETKAEEEEEESAGKETASNPEDSANEEEEEEEVLSFIEMGIDDRILMAILKLEWLEPTPIQEAAIPLILQGRDILAKARTGSGKTGAYAIPLLHKLLLMKKSVHNLQRTSVLLLTPSRELCAQAARNLRELSVYCERDVSIFDLSSAEMSMQAQNEVLRGRPDIIVSTPTKILSHLKDSFQQYSPIELKSCLQLLVIDEADLLLSFGYEEDMKALVHFLPTTVQTILLSATLNDDISAMKSLYLHNPAILKLKESAELPDPMQLEQFHISCNDDEDKFVLLYSILKLQLIRGKSLIFVNSVNRCYKLKIFLENFGLRSCALNSELPINSRMHIIEQFNGGMYDSIIASDEKIMDVVETGSKDEKSKKSGRKDKEYNISRGLDFRHVSTVINFDFPHSTNSYIHRVGRTARGVQQGRALSFVDKSEEDLMSQVERDLRLSFNYKSKDQVLFKPFRFKMDEIEGFRYRARDVLRSITTVLIKEARLKEIKNELLNSMKLRSYFEENEREAQLLRHDKILNVTKLPEHLKNVPDYIVPPSLRGIQFNANARGSAAKKNKMQKRNQNRLSQGQIKFKKKNADPLKTFNFAGLKKKKNKN